MNYKSILWTIIFTLLLVPFLTAAAEAPSDTIGVDCPDNIGPGADLSNCDLHNADLGSVDLSYANLQGANLRYTNLYKANLKSSNLSNARLDFAFLSDAKLSDANLKQANFTGANLRGADLQRASLRNTNFNRANLRGVNLYATGLYSVNLSEADLREADLVGVFWNDVSLKNADLTGANLQSAQLTDVDLTGANMTNVNQDNVSRERVTLPDGSLKTNESKSLGDFISNDKIIYIVAWLLAILFAIFLVRGFLKARNKEERRFSKERIIERSPESVKSKPQSEYKIKENIPWWLKTGVLVYAILLVLGLLSPNTFLGELIYIIHFLGIFIIIIAILAIGGGLF